MFLQNRKYFDYASTTPVHPKVIAEVKRILSLKAKGKISNPLAVHKEGRFAREILEDARQRVARNVGVKSSEIIFTGSATESNNIAVFGTIEMEKKKGRDYNQMHIVTTDIEHVAIGKCIEKIKSLGVRVSTINAGESGAVSASDFSNVLNDDTIFASVIHVQSETGLIQPVNEIGNILKKHNKKINFHTDASQSIKFINCEPNTLGVNLMTMDSLKVYGPAGVGALYKSLDIDLDTYTYGANQEFGIRAGTQNLEGIVGFAKALEIVVGERGIEKKRMEKLNSMFVNRLKQKMPNIFIHAENSNRIPNYAFVYVPNIDNEYLANRLDIKGFAVSTGSACNNGRAVALESMYKNTNLPQQGLRITFGILTKESDVIKLADAIHAERDVINK